MASKQNFGVLVWNFILFFTIANYIFTIQIAAYLRPILSVMTNCENSVIKNKIATKHVSANPVYFL